MKIVVKYRIKLSSSMLLRNQLFQLLSGKIAKEDIDVMVRDIKGNIIKNFDNPKLSEENSIEGLIKIDTPKNVTTSNALNIILYGNYSVEFCEEETNTNMIAENLVFYIGGDKKSIYVGKVDLSEIEDEDLEIILDIIEQIIEIFMSHNGVIYSKNQVLSHALSEDKKVIKFNVDNLSIISEKSDISLIRTIKS